MLFQRILLALAGIMPLPAQSPSEDEAPIVLSYLSRGRKLEDVELTAFGRGPAWVCAPSAAVRTAPSLESAPAGWLAFGEKVEVLGTEEARLRIQDRVGRFLRIRQGKTEGWMFDGDLTPLCVEMEDRAGRKGRLWVQILPGGWIELLSSGAQGIARRKVEVPEGFAGKGAGVMVHRIPKEEAGTDLLRLVTTQSACGPYAHLLVGLEDGSPAEFLEVLAMEDPPSSSSAQFHFHPDGTLEVLCTTEDTDYPDVPPEVITTHYRLAKGKYAALEP